MHYLILAISIIFNSASGIFLKYSVVSGFANGKKSILLMLVGYICGAVSALLYTKSLENINLGTAATLSACIVIVASNLAGVIFFGEEITSIKIGGVLLICGGIYLVLK